MTETLLKDAKLTELFQQVRNVYTFEEAAALVLRAMIEVTQNALALSSFSSSGRVVRAMLHLRPDDGYRRLVVLEAGSLKVSAVDAKQTRLPSATVWRWVAERGVGVSLDVNIGRVQVDCRDPKSIFSDRRFAEGDFSNTESRLRLIQRDVTHLHVLPLRGAKGSIDGTISIEVDCRMATGRPFIWGTCGEPLQRMADCVAPLLESLPLAPVKSQASDPFLPVVGKAMSELVELLRVFALQGEPILISGPTGAGKSRLARWCHENSEFSRKPFEIMDLSAVPEELQMAELFGWKKGAFTGAVRDTPGLIARARGGTLFIDEIDNLSARAQSGLLHVLEERTYRALGDSGPEIPADVRFIIGTNAQLRNAVNERRFREDLYYRINVLPVRLPPLSERPDEISLWARYMASRRHSTRVPDGTVELSAQAEARLLNESWPGNVRQLDNIIRRAYSIALLPYGGVAPRNLALDVEHVERALAYEGLEQKRPLVDALLTAALAFVEEAERSAQTGTFLELDLADAFKGFVLGVAVDKLRGNRDDAFRLFGRDKLVTNRNHQKVLKREFERVESLCAAVGQEGFPFGRLVEGGEGADSVAS
jgi:DNA-binding NtrC family response regulator